jgi:drug/metabolite transporter (DMT)-like permease
MLVAVVAFTAMDACAKALVARYGTIQVVWARYTFQIIAVTLWQARSLRRIARTRHPWLHGLRSACQFGATAMFFASLRYVHLATATAIADLSPLIIALGAALLLGEKIGPRRAAGIGAACIGALIIIRPGSEVFSPASLLPLAAAFCMAGYVLTSRKLGQREPLATGLLYSTTIGTLVTSAALPSVWQPVATPDLPLFAAVGLLAILGQACTLRALSLAEASVVAPFTQTDLLFAATWGLIFFGEFPDRFTILGALVIASAGLYVWHRETRAGRARSN